MATEHIPQIDSLMKSYGKQFKKYAKGANKAIGQLGNAINQSKESEGKTMTHEVEITTTENRVIEEYWVMKSVKDGEYPIPISEAIKKKELAHEPTFQEIAQFLSESKADFVSVEHNYRFADLPFC